MSLTVTKEPAFAGPGTWAARLVAVKQIDGAFGRKAIQLTFLTKAGAQIRYVVGTTATKNTSLGRAIDQLVGRPVLVGEEIDLFDFLGTVFTVVVVSAGEFTKITSITKVSDEDADFFDEVEAA